MPTTQGLTEQEVKKRREQGEGNEVALKTSRSYWQIIKKNVFNFVHLILFMIGGMFILVGRPQDAISSAGLILVNALIGSFQEIRAKRQLDKIALLTRPKVTVLREGSEQEVDPAELVRGDVLVTKPGDQMVVDGTVLNGRFEVDESNLTGESDAVTKREGDELLSGSFCVTGQGYVEATSVGENSLANKMTATAREYKPARTPLQRDVEYIIRIMMAVALFLLFLQYLSALVFQIPFLRNIQITAVILGLIPVGLYTMTIVSYALGALRLIGDGALIQETNAVESLSNVDVLCTDKTGTLTANRIVFHDVFALDGDSESLKRKLTEFARSGSAQNRTSEAIIEGIKGDAKTAVDEVPFSSARKWSAVSFADGAYVLGALEMIEGQMAETAVLHQKTEEWSNQGLRVVAFATSPGVTQLHDGEDPVLPPLQPLGLVSFTDELRPHVQETIEGFKEAGVDLKIISGDNPETVAALAKQAGLTDDIILVSGPELAELDDSQFAQMAEKATVFGRITPDQKEKLVDALKERGHYVAMIGDGVNDVLSLKKADLGIAMESGSAATRGVADIVLLDDSFGAMAPAFHGGQRIVNGMQDILRLFMSRTYTVALIILVAGFVGVGAPFLPTNNAAYAAFTVGIPTLFLALWAKVGPPAENRLRRMMQLAVPASLLNMILGIAIFAVTYYLALYEVVQYSISPEQLADFGSLVGFEMQSVDAAQRVVAGYAARSMLTPFLIFTGVILIIFAQPPLKFFAVAADKTSDWKPTIMAFGMAVGFIISMNIEAVRKFYELILLPPSEYFVLALLVILYTLLLWIILRNQWFDRFLRV